MRRVVGGGCVSCTRVEACDRWTSAEAFTYVIFTPTQVQAGELRELGNVPQSRVRDLVTAIQVQARELRELDNVLQPHVRDLLTVMQDQAGELRELGNVLQPHVRDLTQ